VSTRASETDPVSPTSEGAPRRTVKAANQSRWVDWIAGLGAALFALGLLGYGIDSVIEPPAQALSWTLTAIGFLALDLECALLIWLNRVELELSPERIVIRSRWRRVMRAEPRDLVLPADAAIIVEGGLGNRGFGLDRVGGWFAAAWLSKSIAAVTKQARVPLDVPQRPMVRTTRTQRFVRVALVVLGVLGAAVLVWAEYGSPPPWRYIFPPFSPLLLAFFLLWLRFRMERTVPGGAIEPARGR
jgi:hypothetical protein